MDSRAIAVICLRAAMLISVLGISSCTSISGSDRPVYTVAEETIQRPVQPEQLVGIWVATELNPISGRPPQSTTIEYHDDGRVTSNISIQLGAGPETEDLKFELGGQWSVTENLVTHSNVQMRSLDNNETGSILSQVVNDQTQSNEQSAISGEATIVEASVNRMVMVGIDGVAMEYMRHPPN